MPRPLAAIGLLAAGCLIGVGLVQVGRSMERADAGPAAGASPTSELQPLPERTSRPSAAGTSAATSAAPLAPSAAASRALQHDDPPLLVRRAKDSYDRALAALMKGDDHPVDELLLMGYVASSAKDKALTAYVSEARAKLANDPFARLLDPSAKAPQLPSTIERGVLGLHSYLLSSVGEPDDLALRRLGTFAAREESGYVLCHQVLALGWFEATGRRLDDELMTRRTTLLDRIAGEQRADTTASDLFAERASTLLLYGAPERGEVRRWVDVLTAAQGPDGTWGSTPRTITFEDETRMVEEAPMHTVAHAAFVLRRFLDTSTTR